MEPTAATLAELGRTERLIEVFNKEKEVSSRLIDYHQELIDRNVEPTRSESEEKLVGI